MQTAICVFKNNSGEILTHGPNDIEGYGVKEGRHYVSSVIPESFVEVLVTGKISLYKKNDKFFLKKDEEIQLLESKLVEVTEDGKIGKKETSKWRGVVNYLVSDCLKSGAANSVEFKEQSLTKIVIAYNKCADSEYTVYKENLPWTKLNFGLIGGAAFSRLKVITGATLQTLSDSYNTVSPFFGFSVKLSSPRAYSRLEAQLDVIYNNFNYQELNVIQQAGTESIYDVEIKQTFISLPLSVKWNIPIGSFNAFIQGGPQINFFSAFEALADIESRASGGVVVERSGELLFEGEKSRVGIHIGAGAKKSFGKTQTEIFIRHYLGTEHSNLSVIMTLSNTQLGIRVGV